MLCAENRAKRIRVLDVISKVLDVSAKCRVLDVMAKCREYIKGVSAVYLLNFCLLNTLVICSRFIKHFLLLNVHIAEQLTLKTIFI